MTTYDLLRNLLLGTVRRGSHLRRFSGIPVIRQENLSEHHYFVAIYSLIIGRRINRDHHKLVHPREPDPVDLGELLSRALTHDSEECVMNDIVRAVKYAHPELHTALKQTADKVMTLFDEDLDGLIKDIWARGKDDSIEGQILKFADFISVTAYAIEESRLGNQFMRAVLRENSSWIRRSFLEHDCHPHLREYASEVLQVVQHVFETDQSGSWNSVIEMLGETALNGE